MQFQQKIELEITQKCGTVAKALLFALYVTWCCNCHNLKTRLTYRDKRAYTNNIQAIPQTTTTKTKTTTSTHWEKTDEFNQQRENEPQTVHTYNKWQQTSETNRYTHHTNTHTQSTSQQSTAQHIANKHIQTHFMHAHKSTRTRTTKLCTYIHFALALSRLSYKRCTTTEQCASLLCFADMLR